ncbi:glycoside hydrolase family 25 protein [Corynebacterium felinum]|uniref:Lysozyme n=1 Tax=Corynebacterium felinum TaxID=131318 RepID=A0ABU2BA08_9CORY|nr:glycoside hydrolase family 25 protein [Corynebacterium felinum]MDF5820440.1 glycoside hydrolase family 25 protein [Corynebacterium felinum]MDR7355477.1 GH25 family lysozyme M1 (1,4-beta-N-acetylmuramidase) [Corynebacterium felinum]WJY94828.1 Lysozyme M1 precursor [Corynebacterium felinum]
MNAVIYGVDISNHQPSIDLMKLKREGFEFAIIKATEGGGFRDAYFRRHLNAATAAGMYTGAYVYVLAIATPRDHADALEAVCPDRSIPIALDIEQGSGTHVQHWRDVHAEIESRGYRVFLTYLPRWYWRQCGKPDLEGFAPLWSSLYPDHHLGYASVIFQRSGTAGWEGYGGLPVLLWQFTSSAQTAGHIIDANAFRGSREDLAALFGQELILTP